MGKWAENIFSSIFPSKTAKNRLKTAFFGTFTKFSFATAKFFENQKWAKCPNIFAIEKFLPSVPYQYPILPASPKNKSGQKFKKKSPRFF